MTYTGRFPECACYRRIRLNSYIPLLLGTGSRRGEEIRKRVH